MVDPDGTLDALSNLGLTSPLTDSKLNPGTQQGLPVLHPGAGSSASGPLHPSRPEGPPTNPGGPSDETDGAKWAPVSAKTYTWHKRIYSGTLLLGSFYASRKQIVSSILDHCGVALHLSFRSTTPKLSFLWKWKEVCQLWYTIVYLCLCAASSQSSQRDPTSRARVSRWRLCVCPTADIQVYVCDDL